MAERKKPLDGIKVVDLTRALSGPICTCMLADYGAHVIKVEGLDCELMRGYPTGGMAKKDAVINDGFRNFASIHRNKDTVCMNLRDPDCMAVLMDMLADADVLVSNYRPGTTKAMGIDYASLKDRFPRLICAEIAAFREKGREMEPGYDVVVQAAAGIIAATGYPGQPPCKPGPSMADMASGLQLTQGILLAIIERERSGLGQEVLVKMQDAAMYMMAQYSTPLIDNPDYEFRPNGMAHIEATPSNGFRTSDGWIFTAPAGDKLFPIFCRLIGMPDLPNDPRFNTYQNLIDNRAILYDEILGPMFLTKTTQEWYKLLSSAGLPVSPIATPKEAWCKAAEQGAQIVATVHHPKFGDVHVPGLAIELSATPGSVDRCAPYPGEQTYEVLHALGRSDEQIAGMEARGVIRCWREDAD